MFTFEQIAEHYNADVLEIKNPCCFHFATKLEAVAVNKGNNTVIVKGNRIPYYSGLEYEKLEMQSGDIFVYVDCDEERVSEIIEMVGEAQE